MNKVETSQAKIKQWIAGKMPCVLASFGKDSMVLLNLSRDMELQIPIVYHRNHWFPEKNAFADSVIQQWQLQVHDWPPSECGIKVHDDCIQTVNMYQIAEGLGMHLPNGILDPEPNEPWICGRYDILERPKGTFFHPWNLLISGHKNTDSDIFEGHCPLKTDYVKSEKGPDFCFPLRDWTDDDIWDYIEANNVPVQTTRYNVKERKEWDDKRFNNDYVRACTNCIDPRKPKTVFCPLIGREIPNVSHLVKNMEGMPSYVGI